MPATLLISPLDESFAGHVTNALPTSTQPIRKQERAYVIQARGTLVSHRGHVHTLPGWVYRGHLTGRSPIRHCTNIADRYQSQLTKCSNMSDSLINEHCYL